MRTTQERGPGVWVESSLCVAVRDDAATIAVLSMLAVSSSEATIVSLLDALPTTDVQGPGVHH